MESKAWKRMAVAAMLVLALPFVGRADDLALEGKWLERYNKLKEEAQQEFLQSAPTPGENIEFVTKNNVRQHGRLVRLDADRFVVDIHGKELTYRQSFLSPESAAEFLAGPYAEAKAKAKVEAEMAEERRVQAEAEAEAARQRAEEAAAEEKRQRFLNGATVLADSEGKGSDLRGFVALGGRLESLKELPGEPKDITEDEAGAKEALWQAFTKMSSATELGVTKIRYSELLLDLKTAFKVHQRKLAVDRFCKFRIQCVLALACYIQAGEAWEDYFKRKGSVKKILVWEEDAEGLNALGSDFAWDVFKITRAEYSFYDVPYDIMLSLYWNAASKLVDGMMD